jgi:hypothetical protein
MKWGEIIAGLVPKTANYLRLFSILMSGAYLPVMLKPHSIQYANDQTGLPFSLALTQVHQVIALGEYSLAGPIMP